jgi:putative SOS response-associated peptidase YedK
MPVILDPDAYDLGLDSGMKDATAAFDLLKPYDADAQLTRKQSGQLSSRVNSVVNDDADCTAQGFPLNPALVLMKSKRAKLTVLSNRRC